MGYCRRNDFVGFSDFAWERHVFEKAWLLVGNCRNAAFLAIGCGVHGCEREGTDFDCAP
jgi:hypothetical protein